MFEDMERGDHVKGAIAEIRVLPAAILNLDAIGFIGKAGIAFTRLDPFNLVAIFLADLQELPRPAAEIQHATAFGKGRAVFGETMLGQATAPLQVEFRRLVSRSQLVIEPIRRGIVIGQFRIGGHRIGP